MQRILSLFRHSGRLGFAVLLFSATAIQSQSLDTLWTRHFALTEHEMIPAISKSSTGGFWVSCETSSFGGDGDILLIKLSDSGDSMYSRVLGGQENEAFRDMIATPDGGAVVVGGTGSFGPYPAEYWSQWIERVTPEGDSLWSLTIGEDHNTICRSITRTSDGNYIVIGDYIPQWNAFLGGFKVTRIDDGGEIVWSNSYPNASDDSIWFEKRVQYVCEAPDGSLLITGWYVGYDMPQSR